MNAKVVKKMLSNGNYSALESTTAGEYLSNDSTDTTMQSSMSPVDLAEAVSAGVGSSSTVLTITMVVLAITAIIVGLFALAIFIDFRQEKAAEQKKLTAIKRRKYPRLNLPRCRKARDTDSSSIINNLESPGCSRPPLETIVEVV